MSHLEIIQLVLTVVLGSGLVITAKDFYKLKGEIFEEMSRKYVLKEVHTTEITTLRNDVEEIKNDTKDMASKIDKIYTFLICNYKLSNGGLNENN